MSPPPGQAGRRRRRPRTRSSGPSGSDAEQPAINIAAIPILLALGDRAQAEEQAVLALSGAPTLTDDPWWQSSPELQSLHDAAVDAAGRTARPWRAWQVALLSGDADRARAIAENLGGDAAIAEAVIDAWTRVPGGRARLEQAVLADPLGPGAGWAALVAARDGDEAAADRFRRLPGIGYGSSTSDPGYDVFVTTDPPQAQPPGPNAGFHFRYAYHRTVPADMLVPGLPEIDSR